MFLRFLLVFLFIAFIEFYFFQAVKTFIQDFSQNKKSIILLGTYFLMGISLFIGLVSLFYPPPQWNNFFRFICSVFLIILLCKLIGCTFLIVDDLIRLFRWFIALFKKSEITSPLGSTEGISRLKFFSQLAIVFTVIPAIGFIYGIVRGAYKYKIHKVNISFPNLPDEFIGFKIVQLSDIHCGSFMNADPLIKAFNLSLEQKPDVILFTGDLVNNEASETKPYIEAFKMLKAPFGVYSCLGNHDYGDYKVWESSEAKKENLINLKNIHAECGWRLLMNENVSIEKNGQKIALLGVENWGGNLRFPKYGKLENAHAGTEYYPFKILLSHDPSHWDYQVLKESKYNDIDLTLSGHTHGMQFGIEIPGFKWSPVQYIYKNWAGLYKKGSQYLYVNRGLGFLGYPGRLGIWPEITVIELQKT